MSPAAAHARWLAGAGVALVSAAGGRADVLDRQRARVPRDRLARRERGGR